MNAATPKAFRETHSVAATIHKAQSEADMTTAQLAIASGESERFLNDILKGEDGLDRLINIAFLKKIATATGKTLAFKVYPEKDGNGPGTVKSRST